MTKGLPNATADTPQMKKLAQQTKFKDANKNGKLDYDELPAGAGGAGLKQDYFRPKSGGEAEEAVVVPKGKLPLQGSMVGFWVDPNSELTKDPTIMNDPRRLDMVRPNQFVKATQQQSVAEGLTEARNSLFAFVKQHFPSWPDYVLKDFLYAQAKGIRDQAELDDFLKRNKQDFGNCKWTLTKLPITFDIFTPKTQRMLASREGGSSNPFQVPRDAERHAQQSQMIQQKGVSAEPIIVAKLSNGYDLIEGWHRTIQHLKAFPQGYTGPAWVCTGATYKSESVEQGVAEGAPIVVAQAPIDVRNPKKAPQPYRNQGDIVPPTKPPSTEKRGVKGRPGQRPMPTYESANLSVEQLAHISDKALDDAYHYGRSTPGANFGWMANLQSAKAAKKLIDAGETDIETISDAIHKGWNITAAADYKGQLQLDTPTPEDKKLKRAKLAMQSYSQLPEEEKEKDRVVARAMLAALGKTNVSESADYLEEK
jgi:hypothetical protein